MKSTNNIGRSVSNERVSMKGSEGYVCKDGIMPKCKDTNDYLKCPDGSDIDWRDWSIYAPKDFMSCKREEFNVNDVILSA